MAEESRGKRRKQANPKRSKVDVERVSSLGSEGEDDAGGVWSTEPRDCRGSPDKMSTTPSEGTAEPGSPARFAPPHSLSPSDGHPWAQVDPCGEAEGEGAAAAMSARDGEGHRGLLNLQNKSSESQSALEDLAHYKFLAQLRKAANSASLLQHQIQNGGGTIYHPGSRHDDLPPAIWSPGAQHRSPDRHDAFHLSGDAVRSHHVACPFCQRTFQHRAALAEHIRYCQEREGDHTVCPLCGYTATYRAQMERHMALHNQVQDKSSLTLDQGTETRKFKCLQCGKAFKYKHHLKEHLRIHSGEKPYECSNCKKRFSHSGSYSSHLSSKKCLSGGGVGGGGVPGATGVCNGHAQNTYHHSLSTSPPAGGGQNSNSKGSPFSSNAFDGILVLDSHQLSPQDMLQKPPPFPRVSDLARLWDPSAELSLRAGVFKGAGLLPYLQSGAKFEQVLQEMLRREEELEREEERVREGGATSEERRVMDNGRGGADKTSSPDGRVRRGSLRAGEEEGAASGGVTCRRCAQLFPSAPVLLQHERYLCRMNREAVETTEGPYSKGHSSPPLGFTQPPFEPADYSKPSGVTNGLSVDKSPIQKPYWHSVPQQLLFPMQSPSQPRPDPVQLYPYWPRQESGSHNQPISPSAQQSSPKARMRVPSTGFGSPLCLDLSSCPPGVSSPKKRAAPQSNRSWPGGSHNEPLDLSLPKPPSGRDATNKSVNGNPTQGEKRELENKQMRRLSPTQPPFHQHLAYGGTGTPMFGASMFNGFSILNPMAQAGLGLSGHQGVPSLPLSRPANSPEFLSPIAYMMETDTEALLKKIHRERHALMSEALSRGSMEYLSLGDEGVDCEPGPGRKRLRKTEEGLYACDICEKTFQKSSSLLRHKYEHTGKRPHECKICNKAFKHKHHLIEHSRLHSGEKPYQCDKCGKRFSHSGSYSQHMNHRYAYCSRDQEPDQDPEDMPLTPGTGSDFGGRLADETVEDSTTFLSDSSLDGALGGLSRGEEEEEEEEEEDREEDHYNNGNVERPGDGHAEEGEKGLCEAVGGSSYVKGWPAQGRAEQSKADISEVGDNIGIDGEGNHQWSHKTREQNGDVEDYDLGLDAL